MASLIIPRPRPSLSLDFAVRLPPAVAFSRPSLGTYRDRHGALQTAAADQPRIDHDPRGEPRGLLVEEQRTNELLYSADLSRPEWGLWIGTETPRNAVLPGQTAYEYKTPSDEGGRSKSQVVGTFTGVDETLSVLLEQGTSARASIGMSRQTPSFTWVCIFTLNWATLTASLAAGSGSYEVVALGTGPNGGKLASFAVTGSGDLGEVRRVWLYPSDATDANAGTSTIVHHAQIEVGAFATSYIPTTGAAATRAADVATFPASAIDPTIGTVFVGSVNRAFPADFLRIGGYAAFCQSSGGGVLRSWDGQFNARAPGGLVDGQLFRYALAYEIGYGQIAAVNGSLGQLTSISSDGFSEDHNLVGIGHHSESLRAWANTHIRAIQYWPDRLSGAQLQGLTS